MKTFEHPCPVIKPETEISARKQYPLYYEGKIDAFLTNGTLHQSIGREIVTTFINNPSTLSDFTQAIQTKRQSPESKRYKDRAWESLDRSIAEEINIYARKHFQEMVEDPKKLIPLMASATDIDHPISDTESKTLKVSQLDPRRRAHLYAVYVFTSLFETAKYAPRPKGESLEASAKVMGLVQGKIIDLFYALAQCALIDEVEKGSNSQSFFFATACAGIPNMMDINSEAVGLFHTASLSQDDDVVAKAALINITAQLIDQKLKRNAFAGIQRAVKEENVTSKKMIQYQLSVDKDRRFKRAQQVDGSFRRRIVQTVVEAPDDQFYYRDYADPIEEHIFQYSPSTWYQFARMYTSASSSGCVPLTLPTGKFVGIGHEDGNNTERTYRILTNTWNSEQTDPFVHDVFAIQDVMTHLLPKTREWQTEMNRIQTSVVVNSEMPTVINNGAIPLDLTIGSNIVHLQYAYDGNLYFQDGEPLRLPDDQREQWSSYIHTSIIVQARNYISKNQITITPDTLPLIMRLITPDLSETSFVEITKQTQLIKERLKKPKRGLLEDGITVKITKGQLPSDIPITKIHYDQSGQRASIIIGETNLDVIIDFQSDPPRVSSVNGSELDLSSNTAIWLEHVVLAPLADFVSPKSKEDGGADDSVILDGLDNVSLTTAIKKTIEVLHKSVGHIFRLGYKANGEPKKPTAPQIEKVKAVRYPLPGIEVLDLITYNEIRSPIHPDNERVTESDPYLDYAVYNEETYERHQKIKHAEVVTPHAFDGLNQLMKGE